MSRTILVAIGIGVVLAAAWLTPAVPQAEAASAKARSTQSHNGIDKGVAWVSGAGGVRGYSKGGKRASKPKAKGGIQRGEWIMDVGRLN